MPTPNRKTSKQLVDAAAQAATLAALARSTQLRFGVVTTVHATTVDVTVAGTLLRGIPFMGSPVEDGPAWLLHQGSQMVCIGPEVGGTGGGATTLDGLTDVTITTPADGAVLTYDTGTSQWIDAAPAAGGGGAVGGGTDEVFYENDTNVTTDYTITSGKNAVTAGPVTINSGITVTVPSGSTWTVV